MRRPTVKPVPVKGRRIKVQQNDQFEVAGFVIDAEILAPMLDPSVRCLWAFVHDGAGKVQPVPYTEERVIWLQEDDLRRAGSET